MYEQCVQPNVRMDHTILEYFTDEPADVQEALHCFTSNYVTTGSQQISLMQLYDGAAGIVQ